MQRVRTGLFCRHKESRKPSKGSEGKFEQKTLSSTAEERRFALDSQDNEDPLCSTECPENAIPERLHGVTNQEMLNLTLHQEQEIQQMRLYKEDIDKCQDKLKQLCSLLALKEVAERALTARLTQQQEEFEKDRLSWSEYKKNVLVQVTEMQSHSDHLYGKYTKLTAKANHDSNRVKVLSSALNAEQAKLKSLKEEHHKDVEDLQVALRSMEVSDLLRKKEQLVSLSEEVSQLSSLKECLLEENQHLRQKIDDAENYSRMLLTEYSNSDSTYKEILKETQIVIGALQQLEKTNRALMQRNTVLNDEKHQLELEKQQIQEEKDSVLQKLYTLQDNDKRVRDEYCGLNTKVSNFQSLTERQKQEIERLSVELKTSQTKEKLLIREIEELTAKAAEFSSSSESRNKDMEYLRITVAKYKTNEVLLNETIAGLTEKVCHFDTLTKKQEENIDALNSSLHVAECTASMYSNKLDESNCLNNKLHSDIRRQMVMLEELQTTKKSLSEDIHSKAAEIASLLSQVEQTKAENEYLMQEVQEIKQNQKILMEKNEAMNANTQLQSFKKQTEELRNESKKSWDNEKHLSGLSETLKAKVDELTSLLEAKDTEIDNVKTELQNSQTSISYHNHMIVNLTEQVANLKIAKQTAEEKVHHLSALVKDTECEVHKQLQMLDKSEGLNLEIQEDKIKLATVIQDLEEANNSLKTTNAQLQSEVERTLADHQSLLQDVRNLRKTEKQLARQNTMLNDQLTELQSLDNVQNQNFELQHKSFQECQASKKVLQEQIKDLEKELKEEKERGGKSDQDSQRRMTDSSAESSSMIQPEKVQQDQSNVSQDDDLRRVTYLDSIEEQRAETCNKIRPLEQTDVTLCDITLKQDTQQSILELSPQEQALVNLIEILNEQIEQQHFQDLTFDTKTENNLPNITSDEITEEHLQNFTFDGETEKYSLNTTSDDQTKEYLQDISLDEQKEEHVSTMTSEEKAKEPPQDITFTMKIRKLFQVITFGRKFKRQIRGISEDMQREEHLQDISIDGRTEEHLPNISCNFKTARHLLNSTFNENTEQLQVMSWDEQTKEYLPNIIYDGQRDLDLPNIDHVQDVNLQELTEGQFCVGLQLIENLQLTYDELTNARFPQYRLEEQTELHVQDSTTSVQLLESPSERRPITVLLVIEKLLILIHYFFLTLSALLLYSALKLKVEEP